jgi:type I restriction enzyme S subunit
VSEEYLPAGWIVDHLANLIQPRGEKVSPSDFPESKFIGMDNIESQTTKILGSVPAHTMKSNASRFYEGDVLYGRLRPYLNKVTLANFNGLASAEFIIFPNTPLLKSSYLKYRLNAADFVNFASHLNEGDRPRVSFDQLGIFKLLLPPLAEQHRIVEKIEELFSDLDDGIASLKKAQQQLKVYRQAVLKWAFEGKLTAQWREEQQQQGKLESAETLLEQIKAERDRRYQGKYQEPLMPQLSSPPQVPEEWSLVTLDQLSLLITSGSRGWAKYYSDSGDFFIRAQDINTDSLRLDQVAYVNPPKGSEGQRTSVQLGDLLITITGANVTKSALVNIDLKKAAYVNQHVGLVRLSKLVNPKFVYYWIVSPENGRAQLTKSAYGAGKPGLNLTNLKEVIVVLPSLQEQFQIVEEIESRLSICDSLEATIADNLDRAEALRQSILKQAFEGKLVPQDPNDEPASVLLERIRISNAAQAQDKKQTKRKQSL